MLRYSTLILTLLFCSIAPIARAQTETIAPGHLVVVYRNGIIPTNAAANIAASGAHITKSIARFGIVAVSTSPATEATIQANLAAQPGVALVLRDRFVTAHALQFPTLKVTPKPGRPSPVSPVSINPLPPILPAPIHPLQPPGPIADTDYNSPQGWAILQSGGYGNNIPNAANNPTGPWNISMGAGVRIAVLDSGVDAAHPDIAPNLALNLSEIDQSAQSGLPSACDDGSPQDQQGHGTFTASLATGALGASTGLIVGVAPQATLLNIKVLQRMPGTGATPTAACEAGEAAGLLSWVLQGIDDAVANHANVISLSLGTLIDITTGDGAGWQSTFNSATYAASQSGTVIVAALGNDSLNLSGTLIELPAQSRGVLPVIASTNPACGEDLTPNATCIPGPVTMPSYSNYGAANAIAAPGGSYPEGVAISGFVTGACSSGLPNTTDGLPLNGQSFGCFGLGHVQYLQAIGTSASAPLVAAAAAILHAAHTNWTAPQIVAALLSTAIPTTNLPAPQLNLPAALALP